MAEKNIICAKCETETEGAEAREYAEEQLCEDCFMEALSPLRTCDPQLTASQQRFYDLVQERGEVSIPQATQALGVTEADLRRDFATLRHLELLRACKKGALIFLIPF